MTRSTAARPTDAAEEREKDIVTFRAGARRRTRSTVLIAGAFLLAQIIGVVDVGYPVIVSIFVVALALNAALTALGTGEATYRWWFRYVFAAFDALLMSTMVFVFGRSEFALIYFLGIVPYSFDRGRTLGYVSAGACAAAFLGAVFLHNAWFPASRMDVKWALLTALFLLIVSSQIIRIPTRLVSRIRDDRATIAAAEQGDLTVRLAARYADELGFLERSFNAMLASMSEVIAAVQHEAREVNAYADRLAAATRDLSAGAVGFATTTGVLATELDTQQAHTDRGAEETGVMLRASERLRDRAEGMQRDATTLVSTAEETRASISRAGTTLVSVGERVQATAVTVSALADASQRIGEFVDTVARIARQTNLLALNAAIEAARAGEHGRGFAVVAEEVRTLAEESAHTARSITQIITEVRGNIDGAVLAMRAGEQEVRNVGGVAREAEAAFGTLLDGIRRLAAVTGEAADVSRDQSATMTRLAESISAMRRVSSEAASRALDASGAAREQRAQFGALAETSDHLQAVSERLRLSAGRFTVTTG